MKKVLIVLLILAIVLLGSLSGLVLYRNWYQENHVFIEDKVYPIDLTELDLRSEDVSFEFYHAVRSALPNCRVIWNVPFQNGRVADSTEELAIDHLTEEDITVMQTYLPELRRVDASACDDYVIVERLMERMPQLEVSYQIDIGHQKLAPGTESLTLENGEYDYDLLMKNLQYLHGMREIFLRKPDLTQEQIGELKQRWPGIEVTYSVELMGQEVDPGITELNLSDKTPEQLTELIDKLSWLPQLRDIELMDGSGSSPFTMEQARDLITAMPEATVHYSFELFGQTVSTTETTSLRFSNKKIGDDGVPQLHLALELMQNCEKLTVEYCRISNEAMKQLRDDFRGKTKVVWRVDFGHGSTMTDAEVIRSAYDLTDSNSKNLIYCEDVRYIDFGHCTEMSDLSFLAGMPNLEVIIISGAPVKDLSPFANCKKLRILEAVFCQYITDISPLAECESLRMLNISSTHVTDLSPLDDLEMELMVALYYPQSRVPVAEQERFKQLHPDCWATFVGEQPYGRSWRYDRDEKQMDWYKDIAQAFRYPEPPNNAGWYLQ